MFSQFSSTHSPLTQVLFKLCLIIMLFATNACSDAAAPRTSSGLPALSSTDLASYLDPVAGFKGKIPVGWTRILLSEPDEESYAISFESPPSSSDDIFADYLMVEFLAASSAEGFLADPAERRAVNIDGRQAYRDKLVLDQFDVGPERIDLVVFQLTLLEIGYSFGLYVVGEQREEDRLAEVFDEFVRSFEFPDNPVQVSAYVADNSRPALAADRILN